ncbi:VOC family protein [Caldinitratiruptor microaerophilus]|uniref:VOC domain-containing protein n=1 Tax=Caldinitratiruptor microaerophilus TaxID=671077 RepID=A0AA35CIT3_9FIRM|nr:VOC family protein [Caldinitratiruptor microaerophilus]BDG59812.1 hypothetical protein caldi_09020 [Caldinitratiruptor microaerophilus]
MRFDHLLHWVPDREAGVRAYRDAGFHVAIGGEHPAWGTHNALVHFGLPYVEIIAFREPGRQDPAGVHLFRGAGRMLGRGGGAATFAVAVPDMARAAAELRARGLAVGEPEPGRRVRPDGSELRWRTAALTGGPEWRPFLIQWEQPDPERLADLRARGIDAPHPLGEVQMRHIVIASRDPAGDAEWCAHLTGHPARREGAGWRVPLAGCDIVLVAADAGVADGEAPRITRLVLAGPIARRIGLFGLDVVVE